MAQAFFERHAPHDVRPESAGSSPARQVWPEVVEAMREVGIDLSERKPKKLLLEMQLHADWAVTMGCDDAGPYVPTIVEAWSIPDPAGRPLEDVRAIRDSIEAHVRELIDTKLDAIRSDRTAHELRLVRLLVSWQRSSSPATAPRTSAPAQTRYWLASTTRRCAPSFTRSRCAKHASACARRPATCWRGRDESARASSRPYSGSCGSSLMATVLFVCLHNAGRSQMSAALFERAAHGRHRALSAGSEAYPDGHVHPEVVEVMRELGIDLSDRRPQRLSNELADQADVGPWAVGTPAHSSPASATSTGSCPTPMDARSRRCARRATTSTVESQTSSQSSKAA